MELSPRTAPSSTPAGARRRRSPWAYGALLVVLLGLGVVVYQGLTRAALYFYNADEAVEQRAELGDRRIRVQGTVLGESIRPSDDGVDFTIAFNRVRMDVRHQGDPPELFQPGIPVVLEGRWSESDDWFASDTIRVKHSEQYEADHPDRISEAEDAESGEADDEDGP